MARGNRHWHGSTTHYVQQRLDVCEADSAELKQQYADAMHTIQVLSKLLNDRTKEMLEYKAKYDKLKDYFDANVVTVFEKRH